MSKRFTCIPALTGMVIATMMGGCSQERAGLSAPFTGTWHQLRNASLASQGIDNCEEIGFLGVGSESIVMNLAGLPRATLPITSQQTEPGLRSGSLVCGTDLVLYVVVGQGLAEYPAGEARMISQTTWLDVHCFRLVAGKQEDRPLATLRLWAHEAVAAADLAQRQRLAAKPAAVVSTPVPAATTVAPSVRPIGNANDRRFTQQGASMGDGFLFLAVQEIIRARNAGEPIAGLHRNVSTTARNEVLDRLYAAHQGDPTALAEADRQTVNLAVFDAAYFEWSRAHR